jgi:hypothetical protein
MTGFRAGAGRLYQEKYGEVPDNVFVMVSSNSKSSWCSVGDLQQQIEQC